MLSAPGLTGRSSNHRPGILDCPVKPGNDTGESTRLGIFFPIQLHLMHPVPRERMTSSAKRPLTHWMLHVGLILLVALATGRAMAEPVFSFGATPGKLPKTVAPTHYALDLTPDLDKLTFSGSEAVDIEVTAPTERLALNAVDMTIEAAAVDSEAASEITSDAAAQTVTFAFPHPIAAGRHQLRVAFTG